MSMTGIEALQIIEMYNYWKGGEDTTGNLCIVPEYLESKKKYDEAYEILEKELNAFELLKALILQKGKSALGWIEHANKKDNRYRFMVARNSFEITEEQFKILDEASKDENVTLIMKDALKNLEEKRN